MGGDFTKHLEDKFQATCINELKTANYLLLVLPFFNTDGWKNEQIRAETEAKYESL